jgi:hypothetical protein
MGLGVLHIFDAVAAEYHTPVGFGVGGVFGEDLFVGIEGLVELMVAA